MLENLEYTLIQPSDLEEVKELWKTEYRALGIFFKRFVLNDKHFYCLKSNDKIIAFCTYHVFKRRPEVELSNLFVKKEFRKLGLSKILISKVLKECLSYIENDYKFYCTAVEGEENNTFYDKISLGFETQPKKGFCKTMILRKYFLDKEKIKSWNIEDKFKKNLENW